MHLKKFAIIRILGNQISSRHDNYLHGLDFIINNEPKFNNTEKYWILNRIVDSDFQQKIINLLDKYHQKYKIIKWVKDDYLKLEQKYNFEKCNHKKTDIIHRTLFSLNYYFKNKYTMNNNGSRNFALKLGKTIAEWTFVLDGFCMFNQSFWTNTTQLIKENTKILVIDMIRLNKNSDIQYDFNKFRDAEKHEPQIAFHFTTNFLFNEDFVYGRQPKVELLRYIKISGKWDNWKLFPIESNLYYNRDPIDIEFQKTGLIFRINTSNNEDKLTQTSRSESRSRGIFKFLLSLDKIYNWQNFNPHSLIVYNLNYFYNSSSSIITHLKQNLVNLAKINYKKNILYISDKKLSIKNQNPHNYISYSNTFKKSDICDRFKLQKLFDSTTLFSLAYGITGNKLYANKAYNNIKSWFLDPKTKMNPNMDYCHFENDKNTNLLDILGFYYLIDAIKIIINLFTKDELFNLKLWFKQFLSWLNDSPLAEKESNKNNYHKTSILIVKFSIAFFISDMKELEKIKKLAHELIDIQLDNKGYQIFEQKKDDTFHYYLYNLQLLIILIRLVYRVYPTDDNLIFNDKLKKSIYYICQFIYKKWELPIHKLIDTRNNYRYRLLPIIVTKLEWYDNDSGIDREKLNTYIYTKNLYKPYNGITFFYMLATSFFK